MVNQGTNPTAVRTEEVAPSAKTLIESMRDIGATRLRPPWPTS